MGRRRRHDDLDGVVVIDKPTGMTSHDVVARLRRRFGQHRVGHTGTLDPAATGVLVVCLGRATRLVRFLQAGTKTYAARMVLGIETDSQDAEGQIVRRVPADHIDERLLCEALTRFQGPLEQVPPMVSAIKMGGERLHHKARRGEVVEREPRKVTVHDLVLDRFEPGEHPQASFLVSCSSGTYVRTLAHDVGQLLGVGGSLVALRRLANEPFHLDDAVGLDELEQAASPQARARFVISPHDAIVRALPHVEIDDSQVARGLAAGGRLELTDMPAAVRGADRFVVTWHGRLLGVYDKISDGREREPEGLRARPALVWSQPADLVVADGASDVVAVRPSSGDTDA